MNQIGGTTPCDSWQLPNNTYFSQVVLGYDTEGVTFIKAVTDGAIEFTRGALKLGDSQSTTSFDPGSPLVGLQGYETSTDIRALGFIKYNCTGW